MAGSKNKMPTGYYDNLIVRLIDKAGKSPNPEETLEMEAATAIRRLRDSARRAGMGYRREKGRLRRIQMSQERPLIRHEYSERY